MAKSIFKSTKISRDTWLIQGDGSNSYLVVGQKIGVLIDTGFAIQNIQKYVQTLTDKPVLKAANTHGHFDHTGGNGWFTQAFMSAKALEIARTPYPSKASLNYPLNYPITIICDGDVIDLGDRSLEVMEIPAHAPSSVAYLDRTQRILFTGDEVDSTVALIWQQDEPQPTVEQHAQNIKKLLRYRAEFDSICGGHQKVMADATLVETFLEHDNRIMAGNYGDPFVALHDSPADFHMPQPEFKRISTFKDSSIIFDSRYVHKF